MNWEAVGAVGEIIGAIAVVLSLVYLAVQVRQNTGALRGAAEAVAAIREFNSRAIDDPEINEIFVRGVEGLDGLTVEEKARFIPPMFNFFKTCEHLHYQFVRGALDPGIWEGWEVALKGHLTGPGATEYYRERRSTLSREFQAWLESPAPPASFERVAEWIASDTPS